MVRNRNEDVHRCATFWSETRVGDACILDIDRWVVPRKTVMLFDVFQILDVVLGSVDLVMWQVIGSVNTKVEHEC